MALTKEDKKEIVVLMSEAIEVLVLPHIDEIKTDIKDIKENIEDLQRTTNRIEMRQIAEGERVDNHEVRIGKLEKAKI